ncbi:MAG: redoxin domain-containing protein [Planctomycetota bacterium]
MKPRILVLPLAAVLILAAVIWKQQQTYLPTDPRLTRYARGPAPSFEATETTETDSSGFFRLERYLGRQALLLVFFDGEAGAEASETLQHLRSHADQIDERGIMVVGVSSALPQQNEKLDFPDSFRFVTDLPPIWAAHRRWNCFDESAEQPVSNVFFVDRAGNVPVEDGLPVPLENSSAEIDRVLGIESH